MTGNLDQALKIVWECFDYLLRRPFGGRILSAIEKNDSTPGMRKDDETI